jgi:unsaturated chondroitin disaccharide hydrolase
MIPDTDSLRAALDRCVRRLAEVSALDGDRAPRIGNPDLTWTYCPDHDWVASFRLGTLWLAHALTGEALFLNRARARDGYFDRLIASPAWHDHDLGFLFSLGPVADFIRTGSAVARDRGIAGARALAARFDERGGYILAWNESIGFDASETGPAWARFVKGRMIADSMQNLALLYWAADQTADARLAAIATQHARTAARHLIRPDGSSFHTFGFDPETGAPRAGATHQGFADSSTWSRGQAWLIHGFAQVHARTGEPAFLDAARRLARRFEELMAGSVVPPWDFDAPDDGARWRDSSAGAVAAAGSLLLASLTSPEEAPRWQALGLRLLGGLLAECDLTSRPGAQGFLDEGAANVPKGRVRAMLPYGDYYFMEALMRATGHREFFW